VFDTHPPIEGCEVTSEANPGTVDIPKFKGMREAGFNRISLGAQSFNTSDLIQLGRVHDASQIGKAMETARSVGFDNINLDLMFALPGQSLRAWENNLRLAISLKPEHLSHYCLTIEPNTRYFRLHLRGMLDIPDEESQIQMYDAACRLCAQSGYQQYEISNFALPGRECRHNICYWQGEEYAGYGPGAVGCLEFEGLRLRYVNAKHPVGYCDLVNSGESLWCEQEPVDPSTLRFEKIMLGIRLNQGLSVQDLKLDAGIVRSLVQKGWVETIAGRIKLTDPGRHFCSEVALALV
jgi:oxygen-independent coproporphyrinogen-3 oxidase